MARTILGGYKSYQFKDHDPILDQIDRLYELSGDVKIQHVADMSGVTAGTLYNWRMRKTKRPQFASVKAVVKGLGADLTVVYQGKRINGRAR